MPDAPEGAVALATGGNGDGPPVEDPESAEPIELLVRLAEEGEIDPWDIDIVTVTDKFLAALEEADLRTSARALFYASVLLRMKSDALLEPPEPDDPEPWDDGPPAWDEGPGTPAGEDQIASLEGELDRRLHRKRARGTPETLDELVRELRDRERDSWWKDSRTYDTSESPKGFRRGTQTLDYRPNDDVRMADEPTESEVTGTAHAEDMEATMDAVREALAAHFDAGRAEVLFNEIDAAGGSRVESFLGVLFLAHRGVVRLDQDELFGDLWISRPA